MTLELSDRVAAVTGGSGGIGRLDPDGPVGEIDLENLVHS